eukprot:2134367-Alexandrium_andersonii.AAC.1
MLQSRRKYAGSPSIHMGACIFRAPLHTEPGKVALRSGCCVAWVPFDFRRLRGTGTGAREHRALICTGVRRT